MKVEDPSSLVHQFLAGVPAAARSALAFRPDLEVRLQALLIQAKEPWPRLEVEDDALLSHLAARLPPGEEAFEAIFRLPAADLLLACACTLGKSDAIAALEEKYDRLLQGAARRALALGVPADEFRQLLREKLFVGGPDRPPLIAAYTGKGALTSWLKVVTTRFVLDLAEKHPSPERATERAQSVTLEDLPWATEDPELLQLRGQAKIAFRAAMEEAVGALEPAERHLLRQHYLQGLGIDALARLMGLHRSNAARALVRARATLLSHVRASLIRRLGIDRKEVDSLVRLARTDLSLSLPSLFQTTGPLP